MPAASDHRIRRARLEVRLESEQDAIAMPAKLEDFFNRRIEPVLNRSLDGHAMFDIVAIDLLEIDLGTIDLDDTDSELETIIDAAVRSAVAESGLSAGEESTRRHAEAAVPAMPAPRLAVLHALLRFLETGLLEWDGPASLMELEEALIELSQDELVRALRAIAEAAAHRSVVLERLRSQLGSDVRARLAIAAERIPDQLPAGLIVALREPLSNRDARKAGDEPQDRFDHDARPAGDRLDYERAAEGRPPASETARAEELGREHAESGDAEADGTELGESTLHVTGAGVCLLHPFLPTLFEKAGLTDSDGRFADEPSRERAVHLLSFLVRAAENGEEPSMALFKILCDWPLVRPVRRELALSAVEKTECGVLLESCVAHWSQLRNTSIDALRTEFLQRDGLLRREHDDWSLTVEQRSIDILLDSIPWSISRIRLPWMRATMLVDWR